MDSELSGRTLVSLRWFKEAALYFDFVVPISSAAEVAVSGDFDHTDPDMPIGAIFESLLPASLRNGQAIKEFHALASSYSFTMMDSVRGLEEERTGRKYNFESIVPGFNERAKHARENLVPEIARFLRKYDLTKVPVEPIWFIPLQSLAATNNDVVLTLSKINLIDTKKIPWDAVLEFRKDREAVTKLRRLRVFALDNYRGKTASYIEDDIAVRRDDYEKKVKKWGFETITGSLKTSLSSKTFAASSAAFLASTLLGEPVSALIAALSGTGIEIAKLGITVAEGSFKLRNELSENPVSYIEYATKKLGQK